MAVCGNHASIVTLLIRNGANVNERYDVKGYIPLFKATCLGSLEIIKILLQASARVNERYEDDTNALMAAKARGYDDIVRLLRDHNIENI